MRVYEEANIMKKLLTSKHKTTVKKQTHQTHVLEIFCILTGNLTIVNTKYDGICIHKLQTALTSFVTTHDRIVKAAGNRKDN